MKLNIILDKTNWLEATWVEEIVTQVEDGDDIVEATQVWCESYSGHKEHIAMLRAKAKEFNTSLKEFEPLIKQCEDSFIYPTDEEIAKEQLEHKINEAKAYLLSTDYKMTVDYFATLSKEEQDSLVKERAEKREFVRLNEVAK